MSAVEEAVSCPPSLGRERVGEGFPGGSVGKEPTCNVGDLGLVPGLGRSPGEGKGYPLQYSGLENSMDCSPWSHKESDMTGATSSFHFTSGLGR